MTLRRRLLGLHLGILTGLLFLVGAVLYALLGQLLTNQADQALLRVAHAFVERIYVLPRGDGVALDFPPLEFTAGVWVQVWDTQGELLTYSSNFDWYQAPLSPQGLQVTVPTFFNTTLRSRPVRVLAVPLQISGRPLGVVELGIEMTGARMVQRMFLFVMLAMIALTFLLALLLNSWALAYELAPLEEATEIAHTITRTGDLSRRIPLPPQAATNELGMLIQAFNETLARLERMFQSQRRFLADVSHELRTPLTVIQGNADLLERLGEADPESLQSIREEVERLQRLVDDLVLLAQAEAGQLPMRWEPVALDELVLEAARQGQRLAMTEKPKLQVRIAHLEPLWVCGDSDRLRQVLLNLVSNAVKYTPDGGEVTLRLERRGRMAWIAVRDNGPGIPPEDLPHIFERFYRADPARKRGKGVGLGLSIAYWIVQHHRGDVFVSYSRPGEGTEFVVRLPVLQEGAPCPPE